MSTGGAGALELGMQLPAQKPPRYDAEGRLISPMGALGVGGGMAFAQQGYPIPQGVRTAARLHGTPRVYTRPVRRECWLSTLESLSEWRDVEQRSPEREAEDATL